MVEEEFEYNDVPKLVEARGKIRALSKRLRILDVLEYYELPYEEKSGGRHMMVCPLHNDHSPSMNIFTENESGKDSWCCFVCNDNGDAFRFIQRMESTFADAVRVAESILKKTGAVSNGGKQREALEKQRLAKKAFLLQHRLGIEYRDWLISLRGKPIYEKAYQKVHEIYKQIEEYLEEEQWEKLIKYVHNKQEKLQEVRSSTNKK
jgi:hypothetical protein